MYPLPIVNAGPDGYLPEGNFITLPATASGYNQSAPYCNTTSKGTHELIIGFLIGNRYADTCPRNVW